jgi:hypothetical protein
MTSLPKLVETSFESIALRSFRLSRMAPGLGILMMNSVGLPYVHVEVSGDKLIVGRFSTMCLGCVKQSLSIWMTLNIGLLQRNPV